MSVITDPRSKYKTPGESILYGWDFTYLLVGSEVLSSVTGVTCTDAEQEIYGGSSVAVNDITGGSITGAVNSAATFPNDQGGTVAINKGVQSRLTGGVHGGKYTIRCRVATDASNTRDLIGILRVRNT